MGSSWNFKLIYDFLAGNNYPNSPYLQGGMKFPTQISPLLNFHVMMFPSFLYPMFNHLLMIRINPLWLRRSKKCFVVSQWMIGSCSFLFQRTNKQTIVKKAKGKQTFLLTQMIIYAEWLLLNLKYFWKIAILLQYMSPVCPVFHIIKTVKYSITHYYFTNWYLLVKFIIYFLKSVVVD